MKMRMLIALFLLFGGIACAQGTIVPSRLAEFSNESALSIFQDETGAMWFNVSGSLYRYNGRRAELIVGPVPVSRITGDGMGHIYIPRFNSILRVDTNTLRVETLFPGRFDFKNMTLQCQGDSLWIASGDELALFDGDDVRKVAALDGLVSSMLLVSDGSLLAGTREGRVYSAGSGTTCVREVDGPVSAMYEDSDKRVWLAHRETVECLDGCMKFLFPCEIRDISEDGRGKMLAAGTKGLFCFGREHGIERESLAQSASSPVTCLLKDIDGAVWVGTYYEGIQYLNRQYCQFSYMVDGLSLVRSIVEGDAVGSLLIFTDGNGMFRCRNGIISRIGGGDGLKFQCACKYGSNQIACGTYNDGLLIYDTESDRFRNVRFEHGEKAVFSLFQNGDDVLIGTDSGLFSFNPKTERFISRHFSGLSSHVYSIVRDQASGRLWVGSNGLFFSDDGENLEKFENDVGSPLSGKKCTSLGMRRDGSLLFSTSGAGIFEIRSGSVRSFNCVNAALPSDNITQCLEVDDSLIMAGYADGLVLLNTKSYSCRCFNRSNGLRISSMKGGCLTCAGGHTFLAGGKDGVAFIEKGQIVFGTGRPALKFQKIIVNGISSHMSESGEIRLARGERNFTVEVADMCYSEIPSRSFAYMLEGFDKDWRRLQDDMLISYMNLRPGRYRLVVRSSPSDVPQAFAGEISADIRLRPVWYASIAAIVLWSLLAAGLIAWILNILYSRILLREQLRSQERANQERNKMFIDISHQLRTPLTMILGQLELFFSKHRERFPGRGHIESSYSNAKEMRRIISEFVDFENSSVESDSPSSAEYAELSLTPIGRGRYRMLVVDDNRAIRMLLKSIFSDEFDVIEAENGEEGISIAGKEQPDIILSDVQMPVMDGIKMTSRLKSDVETRHIPVILITAHASERHNIEGLNMGADDYITKPFSNEILRARCRNLLRSREMMKERLNLVSGRENADDGKDSRFVNAVLGAIERNLPKPDVTSICRELGMSRTSMTNKIKEATGMTPREYIEDIKLKIAANMLLEGGYNISEISDRLGFSNPKYFNARFHVKYGCAPSKYGKT